MAKNIGIWIDKKNALIVDLSAINHEVKVVESDIEFFHPKGGSRSKTVYGPMMNIKEKSYSEREKHQSKKFFLDILEQIKDCDLLYILGPGEMKMNFKKFIEERNLDHPNIMGVETADNMTNNQLIAKVKSFFPNY